MPSGKNWIIFIYINIAFIIYITAIFYLNQISLIKSNWPLYRCNPINMFLADNIHENFTYCVKNIQTNFIGYISQSFNFIIIPLKYMLETFTIYIQKIRDIFNIE